MPPMPKPAAVFVLNIFPDVVVKISQMENHSPNVIATTNSCPPTRNPLEKLCPLLRRNVATS